MSLRIANLHLPIDEPEAVLPDRLASVLGVSAESLQSWRILRKSLDARDKRALQFVYTVLVVVPGEEDRLLEQARRTAPASVRIDHYQEESFQVPPLGSQPLPHRPVVV